MDFILLDDKISRNHTLDIYLSSDVINGLYFVLRQKSKGVCVVSHLKIPKKQDCKFVNYTHFVMISEKEDNYDCSIHSKLPPNKLPEIGNIMTIQKYRKPILIASDIRLSAAYNLNEVSRLLMLNRGKFTPTNSLAPVDRPSYIIITIRRHRTEQLRHEEIQKEFSVEVLPLEISIYNLQDGLSSKEYHEVFQKDGTYIISQTQFAHSLIPLDLRKIDVQPDLTFKGKSCFISLALKLDRVNSETIKAIHSS
ncbi:hypothetical protein H8356DRAFT_1431046 [Neocallimastix lanati (nom. inval.)]|nr:hypothetical protein H8356DRAFT_1431046 [Neocallimastix sp. JGI-2020a]